jgi:hypothetical protein
MNIDEIDDIVFKKRRNSQVSNPYGNRKNSKATGNNVYEEEESYENPVNLSKAPGAFDEYLDI